MTNSNRTSEWLFNPFNFIAGEKALLYGMIVLFAQAALGPLAGVHYDGVIDLHMGLEVPFHIYLVEVVVTWLVISLLLYISAKVLSPSKPRTLDIFGTQALARWPMIIAGAVMLLAPEIDFEKYADWKMGKGEEVIISTADWVLFFFCTIVTILMIVWMVALMYNAYRVSANLKGARVVISFIAALLFAEVASKFIISALIKNYVNQP